MKPKRKERMRAAMREEIKNAAWEQIAENGAAALSLRAIARQIGVTAPALYRYYPSRDDLVTDLIVDAFTSLAEALEEARQVIPSQDHAGRFLVVGTAYRQWAMQHPQRYHLIFGTPIPGYHAPAEITQPAAARGLGVLRQVLADAWEAGILNPPADYLDLPQALHEQFEVWRDAQGLDAPDVVLYLTLTGWSRVHGLVSLELDHQFPPFINHPGALFEQELVAFQHQIGLR